MLSLDWLRDWLNSFLGWIQTFFLNALDQLWNLFMDFFNFLFTLVASAVDGFASLFPLEDCVGECFDALLDMPLPPADGFVNFVNWVLPINTLICLVGIIALNYALYFTVGRVMKLFQVM